VELGRSGFSECLERNEATRKEKSGRESPDPLYLSRQQVLKLRLKSYERAKTQRPPSFGERPVC